MLPVATRPVSGEALAIIRPMGLLERHDELQRLGAWRQRARGGSGGVVMVTGEAGAGKTSLLQAFGEGGGDGPVLWGTCDPLSTPRPLGPVHDVAVHLDDATRSALRDADQPHQIFAAVHGYLQAHPSVLVVDDLHWADQGTVD